MKKIILSFAAALILVIATSGVAFADKPIEKDADGNEVAWANSGCPSIQDGTITDSAGNPLSMGFDEFGYNYQAHIFNGTFDSSDRVLDGKYWGQASDLADDNLIMKWSDAWLANVDCDNDAKLDRGLVNGVVYPNPNEISRGWLTNQIEGDYDSDGDGFQDAHYTDFVKIVWTGPGSPLWGQYTVMLEEWNDPLGGISYHFHDVAPGFGLNDQWTTLP